MAGQAQAANAAAKKGVQPAFAMHSLWRMALRGTTAATALLVAILATRSDAGSQRFAAAGARQFDAEAAARQLAQAVRGLNEDRDRLTARVTALEHGLDDITGAITRRGESAPSTVQGADPTTDSKAADVPATNAAGTNSPAPSAPGATAPGPNTAVANASAASSPWPAGDPPKPGMASPSATAAPAAPPFAGLPLTLPALFAAPTPPEQPPSPPAAAPGAPPAAYGADLGSAVAVQTLRARWAGIRTAHPELFVGMQAVVMLNETTRPKHGELRLVVGPLPSQGAAVELCATLATFRLPCQPTSFAGQHLALQ
jgi:hypothetical protein